MGFKNPETLSRAFKRAFACPPGEYRRLCKAAQDEWSQRNGGFHGPLQTIEQPYWTLADRIRRSGPYVLDEGPPLQIYRQVHRGGDPDANLTKVYFPVRPAR